MDINDVKSISEEELAATVCALLKRLTPKGTKDGYQALLELEAISDSTGALYPYTQQFADMALSGLYAVRVRGFRLLCRQAKWDVDFKLAEYMDRALAILHDSRPTVVRMALAALLEVLHYKPELRKKLLKWCKASTMHNTRIPCRA